MRDVHESDQEAAPAANGLGPVTGVPEVRGPAAEIEDDYASGYRDGRIDGHRAAAIMLALEPIRTQDPEWIDRFRRFVIGR